MVLFTFQSNQPEDNYLLYQLFECYISFLYQLYTHSFETFLDVVVVFLFGVVVFTEVIAILPIIIIII